MTLFRKAATLLQSLRLWVTIDPRDNSCTLSRGLFAHIRRRNRKGTVFVFSIPARGTFGFTVNPDLGDAETQVSEIQYNSKEKCVGFETLNPSVGHILYDYGLPSDRPVRLSVSVWRIRSGDGGRTMTYYQLNRPDAERIGHIEKA